MSHTTETLRELHKKHSEFLQKGGLCLALVVTRHARERGLPLDPNTLLTGKGGQVAGLGKAAVQKILGDYGLTKVLAKEGGRTSRGNIGMMHTYTAALNKLKTEHDVDLKEVEGWWIERVKEYWNSKGPEFRFDHAKSLRVNIEDLLRQAKKSQDDGGGTNYVGIVLQHLVGAKLDLVMGPNVIKHHGASVADQSTERAGDFVLEKVAIHVTTHPGEGLIQKCQANIGRGLKPLIITLSDSMEGARFLLKDTPIADRVDVLDATQFLTANVYERSFFKTAECQVTLRNLLMRYNEIVTLCETDPRLVVQFDRE